MAVQKLVQRFEKKTVFFWNQKKIGRLQICRCINSLLEHEVRLRSFDKSTIEYNCRIWVWFLDRGNQWYFSFEEANERSVKVNRERQKQLIEGCSGLSLNKRIQLIIFLYHESTNRLCQNIKLLHFVSNLTNLMKLDDDENFLF